MGNAVKIIILGTDGEFVMELPEGVSSDVIIDFLRKL